MHVMTCYLKRVMRKISARDDRGSMEEEARHLFYRAIEL